MTEPGGQYEGIAVILARLNPALQPRVHKQFLGELQRRFGEGNAAGLESLGRYDGVYIVRLPGLKFCEVSSLPDIPGMKKADVQYGYALAEKVERFWEEMRRGEGIPLVLLSYLRIRDDLTCRYGKYLHEGTVAPLLAKSAATVGPSLVIRTLGWPDYVVVVCSDDCSALLEFAARDLWGADLGSALPVLAQHTTLTGKGRNDAPSKPLFSRFYTLLAYASAEHLARAAGTIKTPQIYLRLRPGGQHRLIAAVDRAVKEWQRARPGVVLKALPHFQLGIDDVLIELFIEKDGQRVDAFDAGSLLSWYRSHFLMDPTIAEEGACPRDPGPEETRVTEIATMSEFRISAESHGIDPERTPLFDSYAGPALRDPEELIARIDKHAPLIGQPVASAMRSLCYTLNWAMANEGVHRDLVDVARSTDAFCRYLEGELSSDSVDGSLLQDIGNHTTAASQAIAQRLAGSYYDLAADAPEIVVEQNAGIQKVLAALYAIQQRWFIGARQGLGAGSTNISAYWLIAPEGSPATSIRRGASLALFLCSSLTFDPARAHPRVVHELTHVLWDEWTKLPVSRGYLRELRKLLGVPEAPSAETDSRAGEWEWVASASKLDSSIMVVRPPGPFNVATPDMLLMIPERYTRKRWPKRLVDEIHYLAQRSIDSPPGAEGMVAQPLPDCDDSLVRTVFHLLGETLAETMAFIFSHNGDIRRYRLAIVELLPRVEYVRVPVFTTWVVENLAAFLWRTYQWEPAAEVDLARFLFDERLADLEHEFYVWLSGKNSLDACPGLARGGLAEPVARRWEEGWQELQKSLFEDESVYEGVRRCVSYLMLHARILALLDQTPEFHQALEALRNVAKGRDGGIEPRTLEDLWHEAVTSLPPV